MDNENRVSFTLLDACTLLARETVSLLEGFDQLPDSAVSLRDALAVVCGKQYLGDGGALLAWVNTELENIKRLSETEKAAAPLVNLPTPLPLPSSDM